jgi:hypothetical protein
LRWTNADCLATARNHDSFQTFRTLYLLLFDNGVSGRAIGNSELRFFIRDPYVFGARFVESQVAKGDITVVSTPSTASLRKGRCVSAKLRSMTLTQTPVAFGRARLGRELCLNGTDAKAADGKKNTFTFAKLHEQSFR